MKDFWKRKRNKRIAASALAVVMAGFLVWGLFPWQAAAAGTTVADDVTINNWHDSEALDDSTKNVGRIWTDKSVSTGDVTLSNKDEESAKIEKKDGSDFLVGLSALSSTAKIMGQTTVPLDIVLVLDVSGSMDDYSGGYQEVYQLDTSKTYYIYKNRQYREVKYDSQSQRWYYQNYSRWYYVSPKTSAEDSDRNHMQFYSDGRVKKIDTLKKAVNGFIEQTALENDKRSDVNKQSRISLVKFAGDKTDAVGNDMYGAGLFGGEPYYNYTQIVSGYKAYTTAEGESNRTKLQELVNALKPAGATSADYAMDFAKTLVDSSKTDEKNNASRKNVKRIVIFFTDGEPNHASGFDGDVAKDAIGIANGIKADADIYTIGVFGSANASDTTGRFNAYMHGMSSNYPNAENYNNLGTRAKDSKGNDTQFYKAATDASKLNDIFTEIQDEIISSAQSPTQVEQGEKPHQSGYITFTDQLGDYMQVDDMNDLVYANKIYNYKEKQVSSDKSKITYTYKGEIKDPNHVYPDGNLNDIQITVTKSGSLQTGDLVTVKIPANMIPLRYYEVSKGKMTISETYPIRLFYDVSLKADAEKKIENPDAAMQAYINANKNSDGQVQFYSNKYEAGSEDDSKPETIGAYAHFVPATTNDFYYFQEDAPLYVDEGCTEPAKEKIDTSVNTTYYYQRDYYKLGEDGKADKQTNTVTIPGNSNIILEGYVKEKDGQYYIRAGAPRTTSLSYFTENKADGANQTGTASTFIKPTWENNFHGESVTTYLGNNGKMTLDLPGELDISKTVKAETGHEVPDSLKDQKFEYKLELTAKEDSKLKDKYTAQKYNGVKAEGKEFDIKPEDTFTLTDGQTLKIYGLESGTTYTVTETKAEHFTGTAAQINAGDNAVERTADNGDVTATGAITGNKKTFVNYTNTYEAGVADPVDITTGFNKVLTGRDWKDSDSFTFTIANTQKPESVEAAPMPKETTVTVKKADVRDGKAPVYFGKITFAKAGVYEYTVTETAPDLVGAGMFYDTVPRTITVTVTDDGSGKLTAAVTSEEVSKTFENRYDGSTDVPGGTKASISASKTLNGRNLKDGEFTFKLATKPANGEGTVLQTNKKNKADGTISFDELSYKTSANADGNGTILSDAVEDGYATKSVDKQGNTVYTLNYRVYEDTTSLPQGVTPTNPSFDFNVIVTDNGNGTLTAETQYPQGKDIINTYSTGEPIPMNIKGSKVLKNAEVLTLADIAGKFTFTLEAVTKGAPMPENRTTTNDKNGNITFGDITYKLSDLEGVETAADGSRSKTFEYKVTETGSAAGVTNDPDAVTGKTFTITLTDDGKGHLSATKDSTQDSAQDSAFTFTNTYTVGELPSSITDQIKIDKQLTGRDLKKGEFSFELLENGKVVATGSNDAKGKVTFSPITYKKPGNHTYTVREVKGSAGGVTYDDQAYTVYTTISDNGDGTLSAEHQVIATITDNGEAVPAEKNAITFSNKYKAAPTSVTVGAVKKLEGKDLKDGQFTFQLKDENGKVIDEAKNDKAGAISFKALEFDKAGTYKYTISEVNDKQKEIKYDTSEKAVTITVKDSGDGYLQAQVESEKQLIFTNTFEAAGGSGTKTGDNMNLVLPIMMMLTAAAIGSVLLIRRKYHR